MTQTAVAPADRIAAPCVRCEGTPGRWISDRGEAHTCYGCNGTGEVYLTPAGLRARDARRNRPARVAAAVGPRVNCGHCEDTGRLVNYGVATGRPCRHCS